MIRRGFAVVDRNVEVGRGELDLVVSDGSAVAVVEVKTRYLPAVDPIENFTEAKKRQVRSLARALQPPVHRVDFVGVSIWRDAVEVRWIPSV